MRVVIDTSSLLSLVRYYLPFDSKSVLFNFIKGKIEKEEIIVIDKVLDECQYVSKGVVIQKLDYLKDKGFQKSAHLPYKTDGLIAPSTRQFLHKVNNEFVNSSIKRSKGLTDSEFEIQKSQFLESADMKMIITCLTISESLEEESIILVTEETASETDNKLFKKIPAICKLLGIKTLSLPELLQFYGEIDVEFR
ncbi:MAG: DUF4411 family protein [Bacteroidetes bacterium]|nr:DUF4411 family protein [Bacteroidota bacterium]